MRLQISFFTVYIDKKFSASFTDVELVPFISFVDWVEVHVFLKVPEARLELARLLQVSGF